MNLVGLLTEHTCGEACWHAREAVCRCSCGGKNHGILNTPGGERPVRSARIQGHVYNLAAVGTYNDLAEQAESINEAAGYKMIETPRLVIDGLGQSQEDSTPEKIAQAMADGKNVWWIQYHYEWRMTDVGTPARVREVNPSQLAGWAELAPYRADGSGRPALLWVRAEMPERPTVKMVDKDTGEVLPEDRQTPAGERAYRKAEQGKAAA